MAFRLKLVPEKTNFDFFKHQVATFGFSVVMVLASIVLVLTMGLNLGIDFRGGTTIRTEADQTEPVDIGAYRSAIAPLGLGDVLITQVYDPNFRADQKVVTIRIQAQDGQEAISPETQAKVLDSLKTVNKDIKIVATESIGPKVSGELIWTAIWSVLAAVAAILVYIWLRFEWQFSVGAVAALIHDVTVTVGIFALFQIKFDLSIIAALLTILGYSINDTVVVFDRLRENLVKYKKMPLREVMNLSVNETLSRTVMTSGTTLLALISLLVLGGDVIRNFVFAMTWGVIVGTYSSVYVAKNIVLFIGLDRNKEKKDPSEKFFDKTDVATD
ncbi:MULTISPECIES: protein translocase subunit SecF [Thioclava]|uniref:Protein-export membrane protein SecF n=1 Tax=Thioclava nitratireducens TaxID=1915078 RepID=A0ABN4XFJ9_9RHOB|nr:MULTISPECIES: protein translocase subunit SecF [Thioclava]AQS48208.1 protein-export membrane protein SecF [Thioclava nitratireducens]OWY05058.1 protein translocase subunit SecF [Thioclava sp. F1Mire-8]OWY06674.1 protein translocase subunit SecF [Thioclava sp. IC9]OWY09063.1 protein translocase subunit SecF [Thioclava sp. F42-5]OWY15440.1 protein translocase subunit SecF [Thioclava sp. F34-6]